MASCYINVLYTTLTYFVLCHLKPCNLYSINIILHNTISCDYAILLHVILHQRNLHHFNIITIINVQGHTYAISYTYFSEIRLVSRRQNAKSVL